MNGAGLAILVNANAKRGGRRVAVQIARALGGASVRLTKKESEIEDWLRLLQTQARRDGRAGPLRCVLSAGGDGTAIALVNAIDRVFAQDASCPVIGVLPLGTGNGWANALGAPKLDRCLKLIADARDPLPVRAYNVFRVDGQLAHFAGCGYDAMILDDYKSQLVQGKGLATHFTKSVYGYLAATFTRTVPRVIAYGVPNVIIENLGDDAYTMSADGKLLKLHDHGHGAVLYDGPAGVASCGTTSEFGYGFRAFPFAQRMPGYMNVRVYDRGGAGAVANIPRLWKGQHPLPGMHDWFVTKARMTFSRPMALQIGGDAAGIRRTIEFEVSPRVFEMLDWRRLLP
jgi:diacylglycerol kinase family enzyme